MSAVGNKAVSDRDRARLQRRVKAAKAKRAPAQRSPRLERWTPQSHAVTDAKGHTRLKVYGSPEFRHTEDGWVRTTGRVKQREGGGFPVRADGMAVPTWFGDRPGRLMRVQAGRGPVTWSLAGGRVGRPEVMRQHGRTATVRYRAVRPGVDLQYVVSGARVKEQLVLRSRAAGSDFEFKIRDPRHLLGKVTRGSLGDYSFAGSLGGDLRLSLAAPMAWSARAGSSRAVPGDGSAHQEVKRTASGYTVRLWLDQKWAANHRFPVVLDPTQVYSWANSTLATAFAPVDDTLCSGNPCPLSSTLDGSIFVGWNDPSVDGYVSAHRGLVHADLSNIPPWTPIDSAVLSFGEDDTNDVSCLGIDATQTNTVLEPNDTWPEWESGIDSDFDSSFFEWLDGTSAGGFPLVGADVTEAIRGLVEQGRGGDTYFVIDPHFACSKAAPRSGPPTPTYAGTWFDDATLTIDYSGPVLPPPIPVDQSWGCDCRWFHGADVSRTTADPVNTANGHAMETFSDVAVPGPGVSVDIARTYNGGDESESALGVGWSWEYGSSLTEDSLTGDVTFRDPTGGRLVYELQPGGDYVGDPGVTGVLESAPGGGWTLTGLTGEVLSFDADGLLISDVDRQGRGVTVSYIGSGAGRRVDELTDAAGRTVELTYGSSGAENGRLIEVETEDGRTVHYSYSTVNGGPHLTSVTGPDGQTTDIDYDSTTGRLNKITSAEGSETAQNVYDPGTGMISEQTDAEGNTWAFDWAPATGTVPDGSGTMVTTDPAGGVSRDVYYGHVLLWHIDPNKAKTSYSYDANLNVVAVTDPLGYVTSMTYDTAGNMLTKTAPSPLDYEESWTYDSDNLVTSYTNGDGATTEYDYDVDGQLVTLTDPLGNEVDFTYTSEGQINTVTTEEGRVTDYGYDAEGNMVSVTSPGGEVTTYDYDGAGRVIATTDPRGNESGATPEDFTSHTTYDAVGRVLTSTDPADTVTTNTYDDDGNLVEEVITDSGSTVVADTTYTYDAMNRMLTTTEFSRTTVTNTYDEVGRVASTTDAEGGITTFTYDRAGRLVEKVMPNGNAPGGDPEEHSWYYEYDEVGNQVLAESPASWRRTIYDALSRPVIVWPGTWSGTETTYDAAGHVLTETDGDANTTTSTYDLAGRLTSRAAPGLDPVTYTYDQDGLLVSETSPSGDSATTYTYDDNGRLLTRVDPLGNVSGGTPGHHTTSYGYDAAGNQTSLTDQRGNQTTWQFDPLGQPVSVIDAESATTTWSYDALGRVVEANAPGAGSTSYDYDQYGDLTEVTNERGKTTAYTYDQRHHVTSVTDPLDREKTLTYDADGNLVEWVTARGNASGATAADWTVTLTLDADGKVVGRDTDDPDGDAEYAYGADGLLEEMTDATGTTTLDYDDARRLVEVDGPDGTYSYTYTDDGQVETRTYPAGGTITYAFNDDGLPSSLTANGKTTTFDYDANAQVTDVTYPGTVGVTEHRDYDRTGQIATITTSNGGANPISQFDYTRDGLGRPTLQTVTRGATSTDNAYTYNDRGWLTEYCPDTSTGSCAGASDTISYTYDNVGNRTNQTRVGVPNPGSIDYTYDDADELVSTDDGTTVTNDTYDADGQLTSDGRQWDVLGQLTASNVNGAASYTYDGQGNRRTVTTTAGTTGLSWDLNNPLPMLAVSTDPNNDATAYRHTPEGWALSAEHAHQAYSRSYYTHDALGSVVDAFKGDGTGTWAIDYDPFGEADPTALVGSPVETPFTYTSGYYEAALDQIHLRARDYDMATGRFTAPDPITRPAEMGYLTPYAYVDNTPTLYIDPSGLCKASDAPGIRQSLSFFGISSTAFCEWGSGGAHAVNALGGGIFNGISPFESWSDAYNRHVGIDEDDRFYRATEITTFWGSMLYGGGGLAVKICRIERAASIPLRVFSSADAHVAAAANMIEKAMPGRILGVNSMLRMENGLSREVDIDLGKLVVQVKSGKARNLIGQIMATSATTGRVVVGYAPDIPDGAWKAAARMGVPIARTIDELIAIVRELG